MIVGQVLLERADSATRAVLQIMTCVGDIDVSACTFDLRYGDVFNRASVTIVIE
jgi:hypothetical protein